MMDDLGGHDIAPSGWVDLPLMLSAFRTYLKERHLLREEAFDYNELLMDESRVQYKGLQAQQIVCCEGLGVRQNPYWSDVEIVPCKGDVFTIYCANGPMHRIVKKGCYMVHRGQGEYRVGSTYHWHQDKAEPDKDGFEELKDKLDQMTTLPYVIKQHEVGIRPTTRDRKSLILRHNAYEQMFLFNGLGTKGVLWGPQWCEQLNQMMNLSLTQA